MAFCLGLTQNAGKGKGNAQLRPHPHQGLLQDPVKSENYK